MKVYKKNGFGVFMKSWYEYTSIWMLICIIPPFFCLSITYLLPFKFSFYNILNIVSLIPMLILLFVRFIIFLIEIKKYNSFKKRYISKRLEKSITNNLIDTLTVNKALQTSYIKVPRVSVDLSTDTIEVQIERLAGMNSIDDLSINISNAFNCNRYKDYAVVNYDELDNKLYYYFYLENVNIDKTLIPKKIQDLIHSDLYVLKIQKKLDWNMNRQPHCIISGKSGSGKSTLLFSLILQMFYKNYDLYIIDPKYEFSSFSFCKNVYNEKAHIFKVLDEILEILSYRQNLIKNKLEKIKRMGLTAYDLNLIPTVLLIDEYSAFVSSLDSKEKKFFDSRIVELIQKGRACGIFLIVAMQNANSETIKIAIRNQFSLRILLGNSSKEDIQFIFGDSNYMINKQVQKFQGFYFLDTITLQPSRFFVPNLHKYNLNMLENFERAYENKY